MIKHKEKNGMVEILIVEDTPKDLELTLYTLNANNLGNHIEVVRYGEEALAFLFCRNTYSKRSFNPQPKVILLDLILPKFDWLEGLKLLKKDERTQSIPEIMLTSSREEEDLIRIYKHGVKSCMMKPIDFTPFTEVVKQTGYDCLIENTTGYCSSRQ